jgi:hypothetical protein
MMPACLGINEYALSLKHLMKGDGVHLNEDGQRCLANALSSQIEPHNGKSEKPDTVRPPNVSGTRQRTFYWRGFASPIGTSRPTNHKYYLPQQPWRQKPGETTAKGAKEQKREIFLILGPVQGRPQGGKKVKK